MSIYYDRMVILVAEIITGEIAKTNFLKMWSRAVEAIKKGGLVVFPTETVYGLGANALLPEAVEKIFRVKGRPKDNPLIVHGAFLEQLLPLVKEFPSRAKMLAEKFWPGPLTIILPASEKVNRVVTAGLDTIAIRIPAHPLALKLLTDANVPVAAPSANLSGKPSSTCVEHVIRDLGDKVDFIIDGGNCSVGLESTVVDLSGDSPVILRPGGISREDLINICKNVKMENIFTDKPRSPGMKYRHYAPAAELLVIEPQNNMKEIMEEKIRRFTSQGKKVGVLAFDDCGLKADVVKSLGSKSHLNTAARRLFALLREMDDEGVDIILVEGVKPEGIGLAIMNRLYKAAGFRKLMHKCLLRWERNFIITFILKGFTVVPRFLTWLA